MPVPSRPPQRERSLIGAWCFVDHYGPDDVSQTGGMVVPGHPHTGLQTVSWLFSGEVEHRDTTGVHAFVRPGELNIMTAGSGIAHSEYSTPTTTVLHGAQLWVALPDAHRDTSPGVRALRPAGDALRRCAGARLPRTLFGQTSPVTMFSDLVGAEVTLEAGASLAFDVDPAHEHGLLCDAGRLTVDDVTAEPGEIAFAATGASSCA